MKKGDVNRNLPPVRKELGRAWKTAIGLQAVDGLHITDYLIEIAKRNIEGEISFDEVEELISEYLEINLLLDEKHELHKREMHISGNFLLGHSDPINEIAETEAKLKSLEEQAKQSGTALHEIAAKGEKLKSVGDNISNVGTKLLPVTAGVVGLRTVAVKTAADFDAAMSKVYFERFYGMTNAKFNREYETAHLGLEDAREEVLRLPLNQYFRFASKTEESP